MKKFTFVLVALSFAVMACSKTEKLAPAPGQSAVPAGETKPGVKPPVVAPQAASLVGTWESDCVKEMHRTNPQPHVTQLYESKRYHLTIEDGVMTERFYRFVGDKCGSYDYSIEIGEAYEWKFIETEKGVVDSKAWQVLYTEFNGESLGEGELGTVDMKTKMVNSTKVETIQFDNTGLIYTRSEE